MTTSFTHFKIAIIGAGMSGSLMAIYLAQRGFNVEVYDRRGDMRRERVESSRSINMTLSTRGIRALEKAGLFDAIAPLTIPIKGRIVHTLNGESVSQPYGKDDREILYSIKRNDLNIALMNFAETFPNVKFFFNKRCVRLDKNSETVYLEDDRTNELLCVNSDIIIGADGAFSTVRQQMHRGERANYQQEFLDWGYKELTIPADSNGSFLLDDKGLHIWPRGKCLLLALPNPDGSFTCTLFLPYKGNPSFESLKTETDILTFFKAYFSDVVGLMPTLVEDFMRNPTAEFVTTCTTHWYYKERIVLIGDACHAVLPFYGQGMNAAFEDCLVLNDCMSHHLGNWESAFMEYQTLRRRNTDALAMLSKQNFVELRDKVKSPVFIARKKVDFILNRLFPQMWLPLYTLIAHTVMPYADALERYKKQNRVAKFLGIDVVVMIIAGLVIVRRFLTISVSAESKSYKKFFPFRHLLRPL